MVTKRVHGTGTDFKEGQLLFQLLEGTTPIYNIAGLKAADGKIIPIVDDTRKSPRVWEAKGADYLNNFTANEGFPTDFIGQCVATGTNAVMNPAGSGAVLIAKANITATMGDSTITTDTPVTAFGGGSVTPTPTPSPTPTPTPTPTPKPVVGADPADPNAKTPLSTGAKVGIGLGIATVLGIIWAFVTGKFKKD
jgi:hypothetical protein